MRALVIVVALSVTAFAARGITAWIDYGSRTEKATFYGTIIGDQQVWPAADRIAAWMHETAMRLFPESPYAKSARRLIDRPARSCARSTLQHRSPSRPIRQHGSSRSSRASPMKRRLVRTGCMKSNTMVTECMHAWTRARSSS